MSEQYVLQHKSGYYFAGQNLYLGTAKLSGDIDSVNKLSLEQAKDAYSRMTEKEDWRIFRVVHGFRLSSEKQMQYADCPRCGSDYGMGLTTSSDGVNRYVWCSCGLHGPGVRIDYDHPTAQDREAIERWNEKGWYDAEAQ